MYKHAVGIYKEVRLVRHRLMTGDPMDCGSQGNLSWPRQNSFAKLNVMNVRNRFLWQTMGGSTISCVVMLFSYVEEQHKHKKILNG